MIFPECKFVILPFKNQPSILRKKTREIQHFLTQTEGKQGMYLTLVTGVN